MNHLRLAAFSLLIAGLAACEKPNDMPHLQEEATATVKQFQARFEALAHRAQDIRPGELTSIEAQRTYQQAASTLVRLRNGLRQAPVQIQTGVKLNQPAELLKLIDELKGRFETDVIDANASLDAVEGWIATAGYRPQLATSPGGAAGTVQEGAPQPTGHDAPVK